MITLGELTGRRQRRRGHDGKVSFPSEGKALAAVRALIARGQRENGQALIQGDTLNTYRCMVDADTCGEHWHIGHNNRKGPTPWRS